MITTKWNIYLILFDRFHLPPHQNTSQRANTIAPWEERNLCSFQVLLVGASKFRNCVFHSVFFSAISEICSVSQNRIVGHSKVWSGVCIRELCFNSCVHLLLVCLQWLSLRKQPNSSLLGGLMFHSTYSCWYTCTTVSVFCKSPSLPAQVFLQHHAQGPDNFPST